MACLVFFALLFDILFLQFTSFSHQVIEFKFKLLQLLANPVRSSHTMSQMHCSLVAFNYITVSNNMLEPFSLSGIDHSEHFIKVSVLYILSYLNLFFFGEKQIRCSAIINQVVQPKESTYVFMISYIFGMNAVMKYYNYMD